MPQEPPDPGSADAGEHDASADELQRLRDENDALRSRLVRRRAARRWLAAMLVVLTVISTTAATVAIWARQTLLDTDRFMTVVEPVITDPAFTAVLRDLVTEASLEALDLESRTTAALEQLDTSLSQALIGALDPDPQLLTQLQRFDRPTLAILAPAISAGLEARVIDIVDRFITSEAIQSRLPGLLREAHRGGVALVTDDLASLPNVYVAQGEVRLDLLPIVAEALEEILVELRAFLPDVELPSVVAGQVQQGREQLRGQLASSLQVQLPEDFGQLTLMEQRSLEQVQQTARSTVRVVWGIALVAVALALAAVAISPTRRRTLVQLGLGMASGLVLAMRAAGQLEAALLDRITDPNQTVTLRTLAGELAGSLRTFTVVVIITAVTVAILAYLAGRPAWLTGLGGRFARRTATGERHVDLWVADRRDLLRLAGIVTGVALVATFGVSPVPVLAVALLLGGYLWSIAAVCSRVDPLTPDVQQPEDADTSALPDGNGDRTTRLG